MGQYGALIIGAGVLFVSMFAQAVMYAWVYNGSGGSVLMPILMHASSNLYLGGFGTEVAGFFMLLFILAAVVVGIATKGKFGLRSKGG